MPKIKSNFESLERDMMRKALDPRKIKNLERQSTEWFLEKVGKKKRSKPLPPKKEYEKITADDYLSGKKGIVNRFMPGQMFLYQYDPKTKETLPYYDRFPLIMLLNIYDDGHLGLNFHYLPPYIRTRLLGLIMGTMKSKKLSREAKANITYELIKSTAALSIAKPAIKRYLKDHIQGKVVRILPTEWEQVLFLPIDDFKKADRRKVWRDSIRKMG